MIELASADTSSGRWTRFLDLSPAPDQPVLVAVNVGAAARALDQLSDQEVVTDAVTVLSGAYR